MSEKLIKLNVDEDNFRELYTKEWFKLEEELKCVGINEPKSFNVRYPHLHKFMLDTLNQFRDIGRQEQEWEDEMQEHIDNYLDEDDFWNDYLDNSNLCDGALEDTPTSSCYYDDVINYINEQLPENVSLTKEQEEKVKELFDASFSTWEEKHYTDLVQSKYENLPDEMDYYEGMREMEEER